MCQLTAWSSVQRLDPQIVHAFFAHLISNSFSRRQESEAGQAALIEFERRFLSIRERIQNEQDRVIRFADFEGGDRFAVGGECVGIGRRFDDCFRRTTLDGNSLEKMILSGVQVVQRLPVIRTSRNAFVQDESEAR